MCLYKRISMNINSTILSNLHAIWDTHHRIIHILSMQCELSAILAAAPAGQRGYNTGTRPPPTAN